MNEPLTTVAVFSTPPEAALARNRLEEEGIPAYVVDAESVGMMWHLGGAMGGVKVQVAESDARRARVVLAAKPGVTAARTADDYGLGETGQPGSRARRRIAPTEADEGEDERQDDRPPESEADALASRAWRAAVIGLLLLPPLLHFYSAWLLFQIPWARGPLGLTQKRKVFLALVLNGFILVLFVLVLRALGTPPPLTPPDRPPPFDERPRPVQLPFPKL